MNRPTLISAAKSTTLAKNAVSDGAAGAALGLLLVAGFVACDLDAREAMAQGGAPLTSLASLAGLALAQGAALASVGGAILRRYFGLD